VAADKILKIIVDLLTKIKSLQNLSTEKIIELLYCNPQLAKLFEGMADILQNEKTKHKNQHLAI